MRAMLLFSLFIGLFMTGCSDKKAEEKARIEAAINQHCERISKLSLEDYTQQYILHNSDTPKDREEAKKDYLNCKAKSGQLKKPLLIN